MHQLITYIKFLFRSTNQHGVHSPFVFHLLTQCIYKKEEKPGFKIMETYRKAISKDHKTIKVKDFGAGSRVFKSDERKVSGIAKNAGISKKRAFLLNKLTSYLNIETALELGTSVGLSSAAIAAGNKVALTTLEGCPKTAEVAREYFERFGLDNIELVVGSFKDSLDLVESGEWKKERLDLVENGEWKEDSQKAFGSKNFKGKGKENINSETLEVEGIGAKNAPPRPADTPPTEGIIKRQETVSRSMVTQTENRKLRTENSLPASHYQQLTTDNRQPITDLIYFDGNHQKQATLDYFHRLLPLAHNDSVFIFDDIHWSKGMEEAWEEIKAHPEVRVSIDSFFWGMVFFRKEQKKEHFTIRM